MLIQRAVASRFRTRDPDAPHALTAQNEEGFCAIGVRMTSFRILLFRQVRVRIEQSVEKSIAMHYGDSKLAGICESNAEQLASYNLASNLSDASNVRFQSPGPNIWTVNARHSIRQSRNPESQTSGANLELRFPNFKPRSTDLHSELTVPLQFLRLQKRSTICPWLCRTPVRSSPHSQQRN
ncbi:hypothetical protein K0M31_012998 [Melipona bicolor]|uniref:Uncharacterized protein n=1 Tax=Melipona bicolor TaxID=60889 RepID=A0AA40FIV7_9HYME|nr:hypothetical protein K0M31_012998 [Melipona bicolor]